MIKKLIIVCSPPASGKTYVSKKLAENLKHVVYLDKDTLIPLSNVAFDVAHERKDREGPFFEKYIRDVEYDVILSLAYEALRYDDIVLINAPFSREIREENYVDNLRSSLKENFKARLTIIWVKTSIEVVHQRMIERNSSRDYYKLKEWDQYIKSQDFSLPSNLDKEGVNDDLLVFNNDSKEEEEESLTRILKILEEN